jgi:NAD(P)-dependent dehydrogenase (short-subunit alcohol dehydrogenase family)
MGENVHTDYFDLKDQVIVITGGTGRLGSQYAKALSKFGANVVLADINVTKSEKIVKEIKEKYNTHPIFCKVDLSSEKSVIKLVEKVLKHYNKVDTLINNAIFEPGTKEFHTNLENFKTFAWDKVMDINLKGVFLCCREFGKQMIKQKHGNIINISSIYGLVGADQRIYGKSKINSSIAYSASKSAIINLTRYMASYWHDKNIRVNSLTLGGVYANQSKEFVKKYSERTMIGRMAKEDEYNGAVIFLCSKDSSYMTGSNLIIDGGWTAW